MIVGFDDLTERTLSDHFKDFVTIAYVIMEHLHDVYGFECDEVREDELPEKIKERDEEGEDVEKKGEDQEEEEQKVGEGGRTSARRFSKENRKGKKVTAGLNEIIVIGAMSPIRADIPPYIAYE